MDIIAERRIDRINKIKFMQDSIAKADDPDLDKLILECCSIWGISKRTAKELIEVAQYNINVKSR